MTEAGSGSGERIRLISLGSGRVTTLAGLAGTGYRDGGGGKFSMQGPVGLTVDSKTSPTMVYFADMGNGAVRGISLSSGVMYTVAGSGPLGVAFRRPGRYCDLHLTRRVRL